MMDNFSQILQRNFSQILQRLPTGGTSASNSYSGGANPFKVYYTSFCHHEILLFIWVHYHPYHVPLEVKNTDFPESSLRNWRKAM